MNFKTMNVLLLRRKALVEHNQIAALENFQQAYQLQQTPPVNQKLSNYCWKWVKLTKH